MEPQRIIKSAQQEQEKKASSPPQPSEQSHTHLMLQLQRAVGNQAVQNITQAAKSQQAPLDELSATFGFFTPKTFAQLLSLSKLFINQLHHEMEGLESDPGLRAEAEGWIQSLEAWLPAMERRGTEPLDQFSAGQAVLWGKELQGLQKRIRAAKELKEKRVIWAKLAHTQEEIAEAAAKLKEEQIKLNEEIRMAFREGNESKLAKITDLAGTALDIGLSLHELANMMREALVELPEEEGLEKITFTTWLVRINKLLAGVNMLYTLTHLDAPTEWGSASKGIEAVSSTYAALITLFGLPAHMALYADLYLVPLTRIVLKQTDLLVSKHLQELNIVAVETGFSVEMSNYPGGWPMFNFMVQVKRAGSPEEISTIPKEVETYLLKHRDLIQQGTRQKFTENESEPSEGHAELPTTGWWFWRELDVEQIKGWLFTHRDELWIMFYGNIAVPPRGTNYRPQ